MGSHKVFQDSVREMEEFLQENEKLINMPIPKVEGVPFFLASGLQTMCYSRGRKISKFIPFLVRERV